MLIADFALNLQPVHDPTETFNSDQSGVNYSVHTSRTSSYTGERQTIASANAIAPLTHSYTIQPLLDMTGRLAGRLYVNLQVRDGRFEPTVAANMPQFRNLYVTRSKSGKLSKDLVKNGSEVVLKEVAEHLHAPSLRSETRSTL